MVVVSHVRGAAAMHCIDASMVSDRGYMRPAGYTGPEEKALAMSIVHNESRPVPWRFMSRIVQRRLAAVLSQRRFLRRWRRGALAARSAGRAELSRCLGVLRPDDAHELRAALGLAC